MAENSKIEWTTHTFNPWRGCTKVSPGCANCYAETMSGRNPKTLGVWGPNGTRVVASESMWREPVKWEKVAKLAGDMWEAVGGDRNKPGTLMHKGMTVTHTGRPRVFCASLADVFEDWNGPLHASDGSRMVQSYLGDVWDTYDETVTPWEKYGDKQGYKPLAMSDVRARLFSLIDQTPNLDWLLLTKRPENIARMMPADEYNACVTGDCPHDNRNDCTPYRPNLWLGTSVENQQAADERIPHLLKIPAAVRFLSVEPLLGPVDLSRWIGCDCPRDYPPPNGPHNRYCKADRNSYLPRLSWVIVGGESGHVARPCDVEWIRAIVRQCKAAGVPVFVKQLGAKPFSWVDIDDQPRPVARDQHFCDFRDRKGGDWSEWPEDLRVREMPTIR